MRSSRISMAIVALALPALGAAADGRIVLDFTRPGPMRSYLELTRSVALGYAPLALILAFVLEALGRAPGIPRSFAAVVWRALVVMFLFWNYERVFGFVIAVTDDVADKVRPLDALADFHDYMDSFYGATGGVSADAPEAGAGRGSSWFGGAVFDAAIGVLLFGAKALVYALERLARILTAAFFILGPLALVAGIPRQSPTALSWFRHFVTVASWPIFSGVLLGVMTAVAKQSVGGTSGNYLSALIAATVMALCALAAPVLAGWIVGGAVHNLAGLGLGTYQNVARQVAGIPGVGPILRGGHIRRRRAAGTARSRRPGDTGSRDADSVAGNRSA